MESLFAFLFKYRPFLFREGDFAFQPILSPWFFLFVGLVLVAVIVALYARAGGLATSRGRVLLALRLAACLLALGLLMRPTLTLSRVVPQTGLLAVLVDNSMSMGLSDGGRVRGDPLRNLADPQGSFAAALSRDFQVRWLKFDREASRLSGPKDLDWHGSQTNLPSALSGVLDQTKNLPLAGVVVFTDGSDNSFRDLTPVIDEYAARKVPIHTVGLGPEAISRDVELVDVSLPRRILPATVTSARVLIRHPGFRGAGVRLMVRDGTTLVTSENVSLSSDSDVTTAEIKLFPKFTGVKTYDFSLEPLPGEELERNNSRQVIFEVRDTPTRVLLVEGRPRWEYKFIRQSMQPDHSIQLESLLRTALNKYYRQGIEEETTLATGFPATRKELFGYKGLILGDVESAFFSYAQMEMIQDFVSRRGGGLLMLGGESALGAGGFQNTPIEQALPVWLGRGADDQALRFSYLRDPETPVPTEYGANHPALQLAESAQKSEELWKSLPALSDHNRVGSIKPAATVLLDSRPENRGAGSTPLLISHRYGRGLGLVFLTGSSWRWQMLQDHADQTHETFWRQLVRWLVSSARDPVSVEIEREVYSQNEPVRIRAEVNDDSFNRLNDARVEALVTPPEGPVRTLEMHWEAKENGVYRTEFTPDRDGLYRVQVVAHSGADPEAQTGVLGDDYSYFLTQTGWKEYFDAVQKRETLESISEKTGGRYFPISDASKIPEQIVYTGSHASLVEVLDLWNMPFNLLVLLALLAGEWVLRRRWGRI
ncbi:MAG: glutamine amidotransferase [Acidobacteriota bacterium]